MLSGPRPRWLTFDCYGTLIQWDEGLGDAVARILGRRGATIDPAAFIAAYDRHEHRLEQEPPHRSFREVAGTGLRLALADFGLDADERDAATLTDAIGAMPPFPEVVETLAVLKAAGFPLCIISNTDDDVIAGNVAQLGGHIDRVVTAQQAGAYKPAQGIFRYAHAALGVEGSEIVHVCASPHLDLVATRDLGLRDVWIDRGTGRQAPEGYAPDAVLPSLDGLLPLFREAGWL